MDNTEQLLAKYSSELELHDTITLDQLITSHRSIRTSFKDICVHFNSYVESQVDYWKALNMPDVEEENSKEKIKKNDCNRISGVAK